MASGSRQLLLRCRCSGSDSTARADKSAIRLSIKRSSSLSSLRIWSRFIALPFFFIGPHGKAQRTCRYTNRKCILYGLDESEAIKCPVAIQITKSVMEVNPMFLEFMRNSFLSALNTRWFRLFGFEPRCTHYIAITADWSRSG